MQVKKIYPEATLIFLAPPSLALLRKRLEGRKTEGGKSLARRLKVAKQEMGYRKRYNHVIVNDKLEKAVRRLKEIIRRERRPER